MQRFRKLMVIAIALTAVAPLSSQNQKKSFDEFRKGILSDYKDFRQSVLDNYDKFLDGVWVEYDRFKGVESSTRPKPVDAPRFEPEEINRENSMPRPVDSPADPVEASAPASPMSPTATSAHSTPSASPAHSSPSAPASLTSTPTSSISVPFYEMEIELSAPVVNIKNSIVNTNDFASQWRSLSKSDAASALIPALRDKASELGLNDYLTFIFIRDYAKAAHPRANSSSRLSLVHYLLSNMGYDIRIAMADNGKPLLLIPFQQMVYARPFMKIDNKKYFIFGEEDSNNPAPNARITTCRLPADADAGREMDLIITPLNLPSKPHRYNITYDDITISGNVNANIFPILYRYPQMPTGHFALSDVQPEVKKEIVESINSAVEGLPEREKVDKLLHFVQSAFEYATDEDFHGFEKPYFFEEMLYYPKCDCEDRSIFFSYLLWNVAGVKNHLIAFPGHESVGVCIQEDIKGTSYTDNGNRYYISDPTYIGASTGACMSAYRNTQPTIDLRVPLAK